MHLASQTTGAENVGFGRLEMGTIWKNTHKHTPVVMVDDDDDDDDEESY